MAEIRSIVDTAVTERRSCYIEPAAEADVLFEQLESLLDHVNPACTATCPECARLAEVKRLLMTPFHSPILMKITKVAA